MRFYEQFSPAYLPPSITDKHSVRALRERILQSLLLVSTAIGLPLVIVASSGIVSGEEVLLRSIYLAVYLSIAVITLIRGLPFGLRASAIISVILLIALSELADGGQMGEVRMIMLAHIALTATFFNFKRAALAILSCQIVVVGVALYVNAVPTPFLPSLLHVKEETGWITSNFSFFLFSVLVSGAIAMIIDGLDKNLKRQAELAHNLVIERDHLEVRIGERTRGMAKKITQLHTAADISKTISALSSPDILLQQVADLIRSGFDLYYVGIFMLDRNQQNAVLQSGTGEAGRKMRAAGHQLAIGGGSMIGWCIANRQPRIALDVGAEAVRFNNPNLPLTRSELALPIIAHDNVLGAISIQSSAPNAFDEDDITILAGVADSLAIALENDRLFNETRRSLDEIRTLNREYLQKSWAATIDAHGGLSYDYQSPAAGPANPTNTIQVPLLLRDEVIGHLSLEMDHAELSEDEAAFVDNVSTQTAVALENARLLQETERRAVQEQRLNELTSRFSRAVSIDEILRSAVQEFGQLPAVAEVNVQLNPAGQSVKPVSQPQQKLNGSGKEHAA